MLPIVSRDALRPLMVASRLLELAAEALQTAEAACQESPGLYVGMLTVTVKETHQQIERLCTLSLERTTERRHEDREPSHVAETVSG